MSKVTIKRLGSGYRSSNALNNDFEVIEKAFDNTLSRDGTGPNYMEVPLDMNGYTITNLPAPVAATDPVRLQDISDYTGLATELALQVKQDAQVASSAASGASLSYEETLVARTEALEAADQAQAAAEEVAGVVVDVETVLDARDEILAAEQTVLGLQATVATDAATVVSLADTVGTQTQAALDAAIQAEGAANTATTQAEVADTAAQQASEAADSILSISLSPTIVTGAMPDPVSQALFLLQDAWETQPSADQLAVYEYMLAGYIDSGAWGRFTQAYWLFAHTKQAALINIKNPNTQTLEESGTPTIHIPNVGMKGAVGGILAAPQAGFVPRPLGAQSFGASVDVAPTISGIPVYTNASRLTINANGNVTSRSQGPAGSAVITNKAVGFHHVTRSQTTGWSHYIDAVNNLSTTGDATTTDTFFRLFGATSTIEVTDVQMSFAFYGANFLLAQMQALVSAHTRAKELLGAL